MYALCFSRYTDTAVGWTAVDLSFASRQRQVAFFFQVRSQNCEKLLLASSFLSSVLLPAWNNSASIGGAFKKFDTYEYLFENMARKLKFYYNLTRMIGTLHVCQYTYFDHNLLISPQNEIFFRLKLQRKLKHKFYVQ